MVAEAVGALPERSFVRGSDFDLPSGPVDTALSRLCATEALARVRKGLYWKGVPTRFGVSQPLTADVALEVGGPGSGPAGVAAAHWLGLTTQVPAVFVTAVPTRAPKGWSSVRFSQRPLGRRERGLWPTEVAVIEVLRAGPAVVEGPWESVSAAISVLVDTGSIRPQLLEEQIRHDRHRETLSRWRELSESTPTLAACVAL